MSKSKLMGILLMWMATVGFCDFSYYSWYKYTSSRNSSSWDSQDVLVCCSHSTALARLSFLSLTTPLHILAKWFRRPHLRHLLPVAGRVSLCACTSFLHLAQDNLACVCDWSTVWLGFFFLMLNCPGVETLDHSWPGVFLPLRFSTVSLTNFKFLFPKLNLAGFNHCHYDNCIVQADEEIAMKRLLSAFCLEVS